jgi:hypothetical protein
LQRVLVEQFRDDCGVCGIQPGSTVSYVGYSLRRHVKYFSELVIARQLLNFRNAVQKVRRYTHTQYLPGVKNTRLFKRLS